MRNKLGIILLTLVITLLCIYYLSLSFFTKRIETEARLASQDSLGDINYIERQRYLDSVWNEPVLNILGLSFTYKELKETELNLGLDLRGGMHVVLEVANGAIIQSLSRDAKDPLLLESIAAAQGKSGRDFVEAFYVRLQQLNPSMRLADYFAHVNTRGKIGADDSDSEILDVLTAEIEQAIDRSFYILRARIDRFGTSQPNIQRLQNSHRIQIELPGVDNPERVRNLLRGVAELGFWESSEQEKVGEVIGNINDWYVKSRKLEQDSSAGIAEEGLDALLAEETEESISDSLSAISDTFDSLLAEGEAEDSVAADSLAQNLANDFSPLVSLLRARDRLLYEVKDTAQVNRFLSLEEVKALIPTTMDFLWAAKAISEGNTEYLELYTIKNQNGKASLGGEAITDAAQDFDQYGRPSISMQMNSRGSRIWRRMTRNNIGKPIAIVLDKKVYSNPVVEGEITNGSSQITGNFSLDEAKDLSNILKSGSLPAPVEIVEDVVIGPTLGRLTQQQGLISILSGFVVVVLFMVMYYARGGLIANVALGFNIFFILGILTQLNASLTLPGIAGIVLTIGMSIDANVLIFERIKEELRSGGGLKQVIAQGYRKAYSSIIDANVTTFITGVILYMLGQGPIKGFAITLMVGIVCSFFTAVFITRLLISWIVDRKKEGTVNFKTGFSQLFRFRPQLNWLGYRKRAYIISLAFILLGIGAFFMKGGLNLGIDFLGGRSYVMAFSEAPPASLLKVNMQGYLDNRDVEVKTYGAENRLKITTNYKIEENGKVADSLVQWRVIEGVGTATGLPYQENEENNEGFYLASSAKVGATIAKDIKRSSSQAVMLSLLAIFLYILIRFRHWQFGIGALLALFHDVLVVFSAISITHLLGFTFEINQVFIAALLTIIGYSINDTVVIFDRIRERLTYKGTEGLASRFNSALNQTFSRTLITSLTTLFVVTVLLIFGGVILRGFAFTLIIGIITGTYSSIFIATTTALDLMKKNKSLEKKNTRL